MIWKLGLALLLAAALGAGCGADEKSAATNSTPGASVSTQAVAAPKAESQQYPTEAQAKLRTFKLWIGADEMITEIAMTRKEIETGMMFRASIAESEGMLFVFPYPMQTWNRTWDNRLSTPLALLRPG